MLKISYIIVNYNTKDLLRKCLENILGINLLPVANYEVIVVDNASTDGSAQMVKDSFLSRSDKVRLVETTNNGLSAGYNKGYELASGTYLVYLGTDAYPTQDALLKILC